MTTLFRLRTSSGFFFKTVTELFRASFSDIIFSAREEGLFSRMTNKQSTKLFDLVLYASSMDEFYVREPLFFGVNVTHLYKIISSVKKNDTLELTLTEEEADCLKITITPADGAYTDTGFVRTARVQNIEIDLPTGYDMHIQGSSSKFNKMWRELLSISKEVRIEGNSGRISFHAVVDGILGKETEYTGEQKDPYGRIVYDETFHLDELGKLNKLAGFGHPIHFFVKECLPLKIHTTIGGVASGVGELSIYICHSPA